MGAERTPTPQPPEAGPSWRVRVVARLRKWGILETPRPKFRRPGITGISGFWWRLTRSPDPAWKGARSGVVVLVVLGLVFGGLYALTNTPFGESPAFIVQSGSMMHSQALYGRVGTIDPGDIVFVERLPIDPDDPTQSPADQESIVREAIRTARSVDAGSSYGGRGDVILYHVDGLRSNPAIVHRAIAWVELHPLAFGDFNQTYSVPEYGILQVSSITIPELGLLNWRPLNAGYITKGDNPRTNNLADQALGITNRPVRPSWIVGTVHGEIPWMGLLQIAVSPPDDALLSPDGDWCRFLEGQAPCDVWVMMFVTTGLLVALPFAVSGLRLAKRRYVDKLHW